MKLEDKSGKTVWAILLWGVTNIIYVLFPPAAIIQPVTETVLYTLFGVGLADKAFKFTGAINGKK